MEKLEKQLRAILLENPAVEIKDSAAWQLPVTRYSVTCKRVRRSKMDILMKMLLLAFEKADIRRAANLAEMLLVEELFIADLINKMQRTGLIHMESTGYKLTAKGREHLEKGIMEEELEEEETELFYSPAHGAVWPECRITEAGEDLPLYRYAGGRAVQPEDLLQALAGREEEPGEDGLQTIVSQVAGFEESAAEQVPCLEFRLYHKEQDLFFARVWNTAMQRWDEALEKQIEERERVEWRETYLRSEEKSDS
ncbi:hypothetical protein [Domibacillus indicus]|uniref:hypothetical protein n=1 Tax=Domibacillus indicus TaxID=1437523 RepID=UPI000617EEA9|nr:hypothetical protein [Domibacillus indicus]